ncbi:hypothetical protein NQT62_09355 [Limnobacter humi]|uniref:DUF3108 domain-containing protein n=1 Tax=Limnobacter humi TaxID=1778671 RepID=A0ABT1WGI9_9BURK|nr:hypothetical protein [Limnobacter humi]MCQ8896637.1 hypothetical protein [Limnobacter humi]
MHGTQVFKSLVRAVVLVGLSACQPSAGHYFPLDAGHEWHYRLDYKLADGERQQRLSIRTLGTTEVRMVGGQDVKASVRRTSDGTDYYIQDTDDGVYRVAKRLVVQYQGVTDPKPRLVLPKGKNLRKGYSWTVESQPMAIHWVPPFNEANGSLKPFDLVYTVAALDETVDTPAGRFEHCIKLEGEGKVTIYADASIGYQEVFISHEEWYAPGVGLVKLLRKEPLSASTIIKGGQVSMVLTQQHP